MRAEFLDLGAKKYRENAATRIQLVEGLLQLRNGAVGIAYEDSSVVVHCFSEVGRRSFVRIG